MFPELAIRELVANALIHQDFALTGTGPMIEIFNDRMEITNPGIPLVDTQRFLDSPPRSRNEALASFLRRIGICAKRRAKLSRILGKRALKSFHPRLFNDRLFAGESWSDKNGCNCRNQTTAFC